MRSLPIAATSAVAIACAAAVCGLLGCSSSSPSPKFNPYADSGAGVDAASLDDASSEGGSPDAASDSPTGHPDGAADAQADTGGHSDAGDAGVDGSYMPPPNTALCNPATTWAGGTLISVSTAMDDVLDAITPDELTIAWTVGTGGSATINVADRGATSDPFGTPQSLAAGQFTADRVALSPDGLRLVVVNADAQGFSELTRTARTGSQSTFGNAASGTYTNLDGALTSGQSYGDPLLGADDRSFYYSVYGSGMTATIFRTARLFAGDAWPTGGALMSTGLAAQGSMRRRPTGISSDEQTLFFWDEIMGTERAAWLNDSTGAYDMFVDLGTRSMAAPNTACTELYYSAQGKASVDLFSAGN